MPEIKNNFSNPALNYSVDPSFTEEKLFSEKPPLDLSSSPLPADRFVRPGDPEMSWTDFVPLVGCSSGNPGKVTPSSSHNKAPQFDYFFTDGDRKIPFDPKQPIHAQIGTPVEFYVGVKDPNNDLFGTTQPFWMANKTPPSIKREQDRDARVKQWFQAASSDLGYPTLTPAINDQFDSPILYKFSWIPKIGDRGTFAFSFQAIDDPAGAQPLSSDSLLTLVVGEENEASDAGADAEVEGDGGREGDGMVEPSDGDVSRDASVEDDGAPLNPDGGVEDDGGIPQADSGSESADGGNEDAGVSDSGRPDARVDSDAIPGEDPAVDPELNQRPSFVDPPLVLNVREGDLVELNVQITDETPEVVHLVSQDGDLPAGAEVNFIPNPQQGYTTLHLRWQSPVTPGQGDTSQVLTLRVADSFGFPVTHQVVVNFEQCPFDGDNDGAKDNSLCPDEDMGEAINPDCNDADPTVLPLQPGENTFTSSVQVCPPPAGAEVYEGSTLLITRPEGDEAAGEAIEVRPLGDESIALNYDVNDVQGASKPVIKIDERNARVSSFAIHVTQRDAGASQYCVSIHQAGVTLDNLRCEGAGVLISGGQEVQVTDLTCSGGPICIRTFNSNPMVIDGLNSEAIAEPLNFSNTPVLASGVNLNDVSGVGISTDTNLQLSHISIEPPHNQGNVGTGILVHDGQVLFSDVHTNGLAQGAVIQGGGGIINDSEFLGSNQGGRGIDFINGANMLTLNAIRFVNLANALAMSPCDANLLQVRNSQFLNNGVNLFSPNNDACRPLWNAVQNAANHNQFR